MSEYLSAFMPILAPYINDFLEAIKKQSSYMCCYHCNVESLRGEIPDLDVERATLQQRADAGTRKGETVRPDVEDWLKKAIHTHTRADRVFAEVEDIRKHLLSKWCPIIHYSLSREAKKAMEFSVQLRQVKFETVSNPSNPQDLLPIPIASGIEEYKSREVIKNEIMEALVDDSVYFVVLSGMGGIGKTTMAKNIRIQAKMTSMFEIVVFAVVSRTQEPEKVQKQIAEGIGLPLEEQNPQIRAEKLNAKLMEAKSFLIILDDVWKVIDLENLGIPSKTSHKGGKIIITSPIRDVLTEDARRIVTMNVLTDDEAWDLFSKKAGYNSDNGLIQYETAKGIANQCKGLPLALVIVGSSLNINKSESFWKDTLHQFERNLPPTSTLQEFQQLYVPIKWSYDQLQSEEARYIFLLCCLFPEDYAISIETLARYGWGLRVFNGIENMSEARDRIYALVQMLKSRFLLIDVESEYLANLDGYVKVHDVVRDMGLSSIASKDHNKHVFLVNDDRKKWPRKDSYENYTHISVNLKGNNSITLPENINCPKLEFLRMILSPEEEGGGGIPDNFFNGTKGLKILSALEIESLPSSICQLTNLRVLNLHTYKYQNILRFDKQMASLVGKLVNLEILSLRSYVVEELPREIGNLKSLKLLELIHCSGPSKIAPGVISALVQLEELECDFCEWEEDEFDQQGGGEERNINASLAEVASLRNLVTLKIRIQNLKLLSLDSPYEEPPKLDTFFVEIGGDGFFLNRFETEKYNRVIICECHDEATRFGNFFLTMIKNVEYLYLKGNGCSEILNELGSEGFRAVKQLHLSNFNNNNVEYLVHSYQTSTQNIENAVSFAKLESLSLGGFPSLKGISSSHVAVGSFVSLKQLALSDLPEFKQAFPLSMVESLPQLENLFIDNCPLKEVFKGQEGQVIDKIKFPKLRKIMLYELPSMELFCKGDGVSIEFPELEELRIFDVPKMTSFLAKCDGSKKSLFYKEVSCTRIKTIKLSGVHGSMEIFDCGIEIGNFSGLETLEVKSCHGFINIFSPPMFRGLSNLQDLEIEDCGEMREVIASEEKGQNQIQTTFTETLFPKLWRLVLRNLPKIQRFCHLTHEIEFSSLDVILIHDCPLLEAFSSGSLNNTTTKFLFTKEVLCTNLKRLEIYGVNGVTGIFGDTNSPESFPKLGAVEVKSCNGLRNIFSASAFRGLTYLSGLSIEECEELNEIIEAGESGVGQKETLFPDLTRLELIKLPKIVRFCHITNDLDLPSLEEVKIEDCPLIETFSLGCVHIPTIKLYGIGDPVLATKFFFNKEKSSEEIEKDNTCFRLSIDDIAVRLHEDSYWKLCLMSDPSNYTFDTVAELVSGSTIEIDGTFSMANLSPSCVYEILCVVMLDKFAQGWEIPVNFDVTLPGGVTYNHVETLNIKPRGVWLEILAGEFTIESNQVQVEELEFCLFREDVYSKTGLLVKGVIIRKKIK